MVPWMDARTGISCGFTRVVMALVLRVGGIGALFAAACANDAGTDEDPSSGQTGDEGARFIRPRCSVSENYGPDEPYRSYTCAHEVVDATWRRGDPTPAGSYVCDCPGSHAETIVAESCTDALVAACDVDLATPTPCSSGDAACWPVRDQPETWRCQCDATGYISANAPISENLMATHCLSALAEFCPAAPEPTCDETAIGETPSVTPDPEQPLPDMGCGSPP
jgi:hypothetical protein